MENKVYRFKRVERITRNPSIFNAISKNALPALNIKTKSSQKLKRSKPNYYKRNLSSYLTKSRKAAVSTPESKSPKIRTISLKETDSRFKKSPFKSNFVSPVNIRYLHDNFDELEMRNIIETPEDSVYSSKINLFFKQLIPSYEEEYIENPLTVNEKKKNLLDLLSLNQNLAESTSCGSKISPKLSSELFC
jgi:hypothetical protein